VADGEGSRVERDEWMSEQVAEEIEDLRRRFGFEGNEAVAFWHLRRARKLMGEMGKTDHFEELDREGRSELEADFREFAGLIHDISVLGETRVFQHFAALQRVSVNVTRIA
jgi:DNA-binding transcriptional regulator/RsmH inhibitor MraZ